GQRDPARRRPEAIPDGLEEAGGLLAHTDRGFGQGIPRWDNDLKGRCLRVPRGGRRVSPRRAHRFFTTGCVVDRRRNNYATCARGGLWGGTVRALGRTICRGDGLLVGALDTNSPNKRTGSIEIGRAHV